MRRAVFDACAPSSARRDSTSRATLGVTDQIDLGFGMDLDRRYYALPDGGQYSQQALDAFDPEDAVSARCRHLWVPSVARAAQQSFAAWGRACRLEPT